MRGFRWNFLWWIPIPLLLGVISLDTFYDDKPSWLAATTRTIMSGFMSGGEAINAIKNQWTWSSMPNCADDGIRITVVELSRGLVAGNVVPDVPLPFYVDQIYLGSILDRGMDEGGSQRCWAELYSPSSYNPSQIHNVGFATYLIGEDLAKPGTYIVQLTLEQLNLALQF